MSIKLYSVSSLVDPNADGYLGMKPALNKQKGSIAASVNAEMGTWMFFECIAILSEPPTLSILLPAVSYNKNSTAKRSQVTKNI